MYAIDSLAEPELSRRQPLGPQIAARLGAAIRGGDLDAGTRLPNEKRIAASFKVSRATVRDALVRLQSENLISTKRGKTGGAFVKSVPKSATIETLYQGATEQQSSAVLKSLIALERPILTDRRRTYRRAEAILFREIVVQATRDLPPKEFTASFQRFHGALLDVAGAVPLVGLGIEMTRASEAWILSLAVDPRRRRRIALAHATLALAIQRGHSREIETGFRRLTLAMERRSRPRDT